mmetsp:Transcript_48970/g.148553  ORF Transcript_48970/g.148553 Transcript_48970/m.148553 type:complete len:290 (-) Transcript_48970:216-1085(-)
MVPWARPARFWPGAVRRARASRQAWSPAHGCRYWPAGGRPPEGGRWWPAGAPGPWVPPAHALPLPCFARGRRMHLPLPQQAVLLGGALPAPQRDDAHPPEAHLQAALPGMVLPELPVHGLPAPPLDALPQEVLPAPLHDNALGGALAPPRDAAHPPATHLQAGLRSRATATDLYQRFMITHYDKHPEINSAPTSSAGSSPRQRAQPPLPRTPGKGTPELPAHGMPAPIPDDELRELQEFLAMGIQAGLRDEEVIIDAMEAGVVGFPASADELLATQNVLLEMLTSLRVK